MKKAFRTAKMMKVRHPILAEKKCDKVSHSIILGIGQKKEREGPQGYSPNEMGVILTTANTAIQFQPDAMACILDRTRVVDSSDG